jgi:hypothetical protein
MLCDLFFRVLDKNAYLLNGGGRLYFKIACAFEILYCSLCDLPRVWLLDKLNSNFLFTAENLYNHLTGRKDWLAIAC